MNENFLQQNPFTIFDDFAEIPNEAFDHLEDAAEIISLVDTIMENDDFGRVITGIAKNNPELFSNYKKALKDYLKDSDAGKYGTGNKKKYIDYFFKRALNDMEEISKYGGVFPKVPLQVTKMYPDALLPKYQDGGDAGADIYCYEDFTLEPGERKVVKTGIKVIVPGGYQIEIRPRSGLSLNSSIRISNAPGTIDSSYRGEVGVIMENLGKESYHFTKNSRIAQMVLQKAPKIVWEEISEEEYNKFSTERGMGFGSSGM